jgi:hypothetical protein
MESLGETMKNHNIIIDYSSSNSYSHGHALYASSFSFIATFTSSSNEWFIDSKVSYHMAKDKAIFFLSMNVTPMKCLLVMIDLLVV